MGNRSYRLSTIAAIALMACAFVIACGIPSGVWAADTTVDNWNDLVNAVKGASAGDTIKLDKDIDAVSSASLCVQKNITVDGQGHTIDGQDQYGMFVTKGGTLTLKNTTIANALRKDKKKGCVLYAYSGGGASFENCVIYNCKDSYSSSTGVINCSSYKLEMTNCTVIDSSNGVTAGSSGRVANSILTGSSGTDLIFSSSSSSFADGGYNLIGKTSRQPEAFRTETTIISEELSDHSSWLTSEGYLIAAANNPAIDKIPDGDTYKDIGGRQHESTDDVESIEIVSPPDKTDYLEGQKFSRNGMTVRAHYTDGSSKDIISYTCEPSGALKLTDSRIVVSFGGAETEQTITVSEADVIDDASKLKDAINENNNTGGAVLKLEDDIDLDSSWTSSVTVSKDLIIDGNGHTVDGQGKYSLYLSPSSSAKLTVKNLEAKNMLQSSSSSGSAFINCSSSYSGTITLQNLVLRGNKSYNGVIYFYTGSGATLNMDHCTVIDNVSTRTSSSGYTALYVRGGKANVNDCILVNNAYGSEKRDITVYSSSTTFNAKNNIVGIISGKTLDSAVNKVSAAYNDYENWMDTNGELFYPPMDGDNPAVDIHSGEEPSDDLKTDLAGKVRPQGRGGDAGAYESDVLDAATPTLSADLSPDPDKYTVGDDASPLSIKAKIKDNGSLHYEWYYIDYTYNDNTDEVTTATKMVSGADSDSLTPPTDSVGTRAYFAVAYNKNTENTWINGKNGVFAEDADADTKRKASVYAISEHHPVIVSAVAGLELVGLEVTKAPDRTEYIEGQKFDPAGIEVSGIYQNAAGDITKKYPISAGYTFSPAGALAVTDTAVTIEYEGVTTEQPVTVVQKVTEKIEETAPPAKLRYNEGDSFDKSGMVITATYNDGSVRELGADEYTADPADNLTRDVTEVTLKYTGEDGREFSVTQAITVGINNIEQLREALAAANAGDTLTLTADITMDDQAALPVDRDLTIEGGGHRIFGADNGFIEHTGGELILRDLDICGSASGNGAVLYSHGSCGDATVRNCIIRSNAAVKGAIFFDPDEDKKLSVAYSTIIDNKSATKEADRSGTKKLMSKSAPSGYAGGINVSDNGSLELYADIIAGNMLSTRYEDYDIRAGRIISNGCNVIGVSSDFDAAASDRTGSQFDDHEAWLNADGTPVNSETNILLAEGYRPAAGAGDTDLTGKQRSTETNAGALEISDDYSHGDKPDDSEEPDPADKEAAAAVEAMIDALPSASDITLEDESAVSDAAAAFDNLTEEQKALVDAAKAAKLADAADRIKTLKDAAAVNEASELIDALPASGGITLENEEAVAAALAAYEALTDEQKAAVSPELKTKLELADAAVGRLRAEDSASKAEADKQKAEEEKAAAEAEKLQAQAEKEAAEADKLKAEAERDAAEADKLKAEAERSAAEADKLKAEAEKSAAEAEKYKAEAEKVKAEAAKAQAETAKAEAETKAAEAEAAKAEADIKAAEAETARLKAESDKAAADAAKTAADTKAAEAEAARLKAESDKAAADAAKAAADAEKAKAEAAKTQAEADKAAAEAKEAEAKAAKAAAETKAAEAEAAKAAAETKAAEAETARTAAEAKAADAEAARAAAETKAAEAESKAAEAGNTAAEIKALKLENERLVVRSKKVTGIKATAKKSRKVLVKFKSLGKGYTYEVKYSTKKNKGFKTAKTSGTKVTVTKLNKGKTYYFKVRGVRKVGNKKVYTGYSKTVKVKIK